MAIQMRRGQEVNFDADKMLPGEWAVSLDSKIIRMCFAPGVCVRMATYDAFEVDMAKIEAILAECQTIEEVVTRINTEVSANAQAVAEYTSQAKQYRDEAEEFRNQAEEIVGYGYASKEDAGIIRGGDNYIDENGTLVLTRATTDRELIESQNGGIRIISMDGESQQKQYSGKNLYDEVKNNIEVNHSGIKFTKNEYGNLTLSGTTTASINAVMNPFTLPAGTYYYQKGTVKNVSVRLYNRTTSAFIAYDNGSFTLAEESTLDVRVQSNSGSTISGTIKIQIEKGSTMTEYEPYVGGIASPNPEYEQDVDSVEVSEIWTESKNIVTEESVSTTYSAYITTENQWRYSIDSKSVRVKARPNTTYTVSISETVSLFRVGCINSERYPSTDGEAFILTNVVRNTSNVPITITTPQDTQYIVVQVPMATKTDTLQIEKGSVVTPYQKHFESKETLSETITLRGIGDVKDVLCKMNGVYGVVRRFPEYIFSGTETLSLQSAGYVVLDASHLPYPSAKTNRIYCTHFRNVSGSELATCDYGVYLGNSINIRNKDFSTVDEYKNFFNNNDVKCVYESTPTFEPLPLADQIALHKLESFGGVTYLFTDSTIEPIIEVEYGTSKVGGYAIKGLNNGEISLLELEQLKTLTNELATQIVAGSEA